MHRELLEFRGRLVAFPLGEGDPLLGGDDVGPGATARRIDEAGEFGLSLHHPRGGLRHGGAGRGHPRLRLLHDEPAIVDLLATDDRSAKQPLTKLKLVASVGQIGICLEDPRFGRRLCRTGRRDGRLPGRHRGPQRLHVGNRGVDLAPPRCHFSGRPSAVHPEEQVAPPHIGSDCGLHRLHDAGHVRGDRDRFARRLAGADGADQAAGLDPRGGERLGTGLRDRPTRCRFAHDGGPVRGHEIDAACECTEARDGQTYREEPAATTHACASADVVDFRSMRSIRPSDI